MSGPTSGSRGGAPTSPRADSPARAGHVNPTTSVPSSHLRMAPPASTPYASVLGHGILRPARRHGRRAHESVRRRCRRVGVHLFPRTLRSRAPQRVTRPSGTSSLVLRVRPLSRVAATKRNYPSDDGAAARDHHHHDHHDEHGATPDATSNTTAPIHATGCARRQAGPSGEQHSSTAFASDRRAVVRVGDHPSSLRRVGRRAPSRTAVASRALARARPTSESDGAVPGRRLSIGHQTRDCPPLTRQMFPFAQRPAGETR